MPQSTNTTETIDPTMDSWPSVQQLDEFLDRHGHYTKGSPLPLTPDQEQSGDICCQILSAWHGVEHADMKLKHVYEKGKHVGTALFKQAMTRGNKGWSHIVGIVQYFDLLEKETANEATATKRGLREVQKTGEVPDDLDVLLEVEWGSLQKLDKGFFKGANEAMLALSAEQRKLQVEVSSGQAVLGLDLIPGPILSSGFGSSAA